MAPRIDVTTLTAPVHGADLEAASVRYRIPISDWLDLSAAINPSTYPLPLLPADALRQLPYTLHAAQVAAKEYCAAPVLPIFAAGSQVLIQWLPLVHRNLHTGRRVAVPDIGYAEHAFRWQWAGYDVVFYDPRIPEKVDELLQHDAIDVLIVITPHNPFAHIVKPYRLLQWQAALQRNNTHRQSTSGKWLIVDEAFVDATPTSSLAGVAAMPGLIVLRSLGKFFGLAGVRCGYAFCHPGIGKALEIAIGPWPLSTPALAAATCALRDNEWQNTMRNRLAQWSVQNAELLARAAGIEAATIYRHALFNCIELPLQQAVAVEEYFARRAIRVRRIDIDAETALLRFGLVDPAAANQWARLTEAVGSAVGLNSNRFTG